MKKLKIYILAILVPIIFVGCMEKGKSNTSIDTGTIVMDKDLANRVYTNMSYLKHIYETTAYNSKDCISPYTDDSIYSYLFQIYTSYNYGEGTQNEIEIYESKISDKKKLFFPVNNLLSYENIYTTDSNITKQLNILTKPDSTDTAYIQDLRDAQSYIASIYLQITNRLSSNSHYIELEESILLKNYLMRMKTSDQSMTLLALLQYYNILDNQTLQEKYIKLSKLVTQDLDILNNKSVVIDINELLNTSNRITSVYAIKDVYSSDQIKTLKDSLTIIKTLYANYSLNANEILRKEQEFYNTERTILTTLTENYYYKIRFSGTKIRVDYKNGVDIYAKLKAIYDLQKSDIDNVKLKVIIENIKSNIDKLNDYDALSLKDNYSACVLAGQLIQLLKDNNLFIQTVIQMNP